MPEAINACQDDQLCAVLKAGIDGAVYGVQAIWDTILSIEDWGFLLVDEKSVFNEIHRIGMLWAVFHLWLYGARFYFNCYCHWSLIILRNGNGKAKFSA